MRNKSSHNKIIASYQNCDNDNENLWGNISLHCLGKYNYLSYWGEATNRCYHINVFHIHMIACYTACRFAYTLIINLRVPCNVFKYLEQV